MHHPERQPLVSVVIPAYNAGDTLAEAVESVRRQTLTDWEIVVCDDGSTDATAERLRLLALQEPRLRWVRQANAGAGTARNTALAAARGRLFKFLDADDRLEPGCLAALVPEAERSGAACGAWSIDDQSGRPTHITVSLGTEAVGMRRLLSDNPVAPSAAMVSREVMSLEAFSDAPAAADYDLWLRLARHGIRWAPVAEPVARYRLLPSSNSKKCAEALRAVIGFLRDAYEWAEDDPRLDASPERFAQTVRDHALRYATLQALLDPSPGQDDACDLVSGALARTIGPRRASGSLVGDAAFEATLAAIAQRPDPRAPEAWSRPLRRWWDAVEAECWADAGFRGSAIDRFARRAVDPMRVAERLLDGVGASVVLLGHGSNGRLIESVARMHGLEVSVRDDRYEARSRADAARVESEPMSAPLQGRTAIITPLADGSLAERFPAARRWSAELASQTTEMRRLVQAALGRSLAA